MIIATIKKLDGTYLDHGKFASEEAANIWFAPFMASGVYGKLEHYTQVPVEPEQLNEQGFPVTQDVFVPAEFTIEFEPFVEDTTFSKIEAGKKAREACVRCLDLIAGYNLERELTASQINDLQIQFSPIQTALMTSRPHTAKNLISAIEPDGVLVTEELKSLVLNELQEF